MPKRVVIVGGGPAGNTAASHAARLGASVTMVESDVIGGAAHLRDCIPSKAMIATGGALAAVRRSPEMGLTPAVAGVDPAVLRARIDAIEDRLESETTQLLERQGVQLLRGTGRLTGEHEVTVSGSDGELRLEADAIVLATGSRPRLPEWAAVDGTRVLSTRDAYPRRTGPSTSS